MKTIIIFIVSIFTICACTGIRESTRVLIENEKIASDDTLQYELVIIDPGFETWFVTHSKPVWFHSQSWLETWNRQYVTAWNARYMNGRGNRCCDTYIDYQFHVDYGLDLNHKLYWYFRYVERKLGMAILPEGIRRQDY
ncbi:MAG TPA: hypothetical protein DCY35_08410 [Prolixibacteraceae bacterium]|nr:hypothetical protein [Prolixibacteraceae bacterium]